MIDRKLEKIELEKNEAAYRAMEDELKARYHLKYVLFEKGVFVGAFDTDSDALKVAAAKFGWGPFMLKQVGRGIGYLPPYVTIPRDPEWENG